MGFLAKLKQMFSNNIIYKEPEDVNLGVLYKNKAVKMRVGAYLVVEDDCTCVVVYKSSITDFLYGKGKFRIGSDDMPKLFKKALTPKNPDPKDIKAELYFIKSTVKKCFVFASSRPFIIRSKDYGKIVGQVDGLCEVVITNAKDFFNWLFLIKRHFRNGVIDSIVSEQIGNAISRAIESSKVDIQDIVLKNVNINDYLNIELENTFDDLGFAVKNIYLKSLQFNSRTEEKINAIIERNYEKINKTETKYITVTTRAEREDGAETVRELNLENENSDIICHNCGKLVDRGYGYCPYCGSKIEK